MAPSITLARAARSDRAELIRANQDSSAHHLPWVAPFADDVGFDAWFVRSLTGPNVGLVAREITSAHAVGIVNISDIVLGAFRGAYLGYCGMHGAPGAACRLTSFGECFSGHSGETAMDRIAFEAELQRDGYEIVARTMAADQLNDTHTHAFDARVLVIEGEMTVTRDGTPRTYRPGQSFEMPSGCQHAEQAGAAGTAYVAGRRAPR